MSKGWIAIPLNALSFALKLADIPADGHGDEDVVPIGLDPEHVTEEIARHATDDDRPRVL